MAERAINTCDGCGSSYFADASRMSGLCPECAHWLYGYDNCRHQMLDGRCTHCHWDGSRSDHVIRQLATIAEPPA